VTQIENAAHKQQDLALTEKQTDEIPPQYKRPGGAALEQATRNCKKK
jgi:hypothetical protein